MTPSPFLFFLFSGLAEEMDVSRNQRTFVFPTITVICALYLTVVP